MHKLRWLVWATAIVLVATSTAFLIRYVKPRRPNGSTSQVAKNDQYGAKVSSEEEETPTPPEPINVKVVHPYRGAMERITVQVGSIQAYQTVNLYVKASGFLKTQNVDIGDRVKRGQILAVVDVPELEKQVDRNAALLAQAKARVVQMKTKIKIAEADRKAAEAKEVEAHANAESAAAWVRYRDRVLKRIRELVASRSLEEKLLDEAKERYTASVETANAAQAAITTAKANITAMAAKIDGAIADVAVSETEVKVADAELAKTQVQLRFATIEAPFDGFITHRSLFPGDYVRSPTEGGGNLPLLTIQRTDRMRAIVQIPDRDVPYADPGDPAFVEIDALPGEKIPAKVSRIAHSEDAQTRLMHVEIDLPNPKGSIRQGMYGRVTIILDKSNDQLSIPSACLLGKTDQGKGMVYVVREGHIHRATVKLGIDNGLRVEVLQGLTADDNVIFQPSNALSEGGEATTTLIEEAASKSAALER